ncbi:MAG: nucleotidyltransferase family protein [Cyanobacteria bacterium J06638_38]
MMNIKPLSYQRLGYHLSREQKLLLQAAALQGQPGISAWEQWQKLVDLENLDSASNALLCQLYRNLTVNQVQHQYLTRLKGIYKRNWYGNQLKLQKLQTVLIAFESHSLEVLVLDEIALIEQYYQDRGSSPIHQLNLLIYPEVMEQGRLTLQQLGWKLVMQGVSAEDLWLQFQDDSGVQLCLWGNLFHYSPFPSVLIAKQLWNETSACNLGVNTAILSPNNLLLRLSSRIFQRGQKPQLGMLLDGMTICQNESINWIELIAQAQSYQVILPLRNMLSLLQQVCQLEVPPWAISALYQIPLSNRELVEYQILATNRKTLLKSWLIRPLTKLKAAFA